LTNTFHLAFGEHSQVQIMHIMIDLLSRFGINLLTSHSQLKQILSYVSSSNRLAVQERVKILNRYLFIYSFII